MAMRSGVALVAVGLLLALAGCVPSAPYGTDSPESIATPAFTSDAAALKAAEAAYAAYEAAVDKSLQTGSPEGLDLVATGDALKTATDSVNSFKKLGRTQRGSSVISRVSAADLSILTESDGSAGLAQIYACLDVSAVQVVDSGGTVVSSPDRQTVFPTLVSLKWLAAKQVLLVSEETVWDGKNFCA